MSPCACEYKFLEGLGACKCSRYVNENGYGNCKKSYGAKGPLCYVIQPTTCTDKVRSGDGRKYSYEACKQPHSSPGKN